MKAQPSNIQGNHSTSVAQISRGPIDYILLGHGREVDLTSTLALPYNINSQSNTSVFNERK